MTQEDLLVIRGNELLTRFVRAQDRLHRIAELAAKLVENPLSAEQLAEVDEHVAVVSDEFLEARSELAAYQSLLKARRNIN